MMKRRSWRARERGEDQNFAALHDGVPSWLWPSLWSWFLEAIQAICNHYANTAPGDVVRILERGMRTDLQSEAVSHHGIYEVRPVFASDSDVFLDAVNEVLTLLRDPWARRTVESLEFILAHAGSLWRLSDDQSDLQLVRRVAAEAQEAATSAMSAPDVASVHLRKAWHDVYGRTPDPSDGYREAVKAVEAIAQPVIAPLDAAATLGKMIAAMKSKPSKWSSVLRHPQDPEAQVLNVASMMEAVWKGQHDRHGTPDESKPLDVSAAEAEAALAIAVALVHLFRAHAISTTEG